MFFKRGKPAKYKKVELCDGVEWKALQFIPEYIWVNTVANIETQLETCTGAGLSVAIDQGYGICASGEARPSVNADPLLQHGSNPNEINYRFTESHINLGVGGHYSPATTFTLTGSSFSSSSLPTVTPISPSLQYNNCYTHGQKRDNDATDRLVAWLCKQ